MKLRPATVKDIAVLQTMEQGVVAAERPYNPAIRESDVQYYNLEALLEEDNSHLLVAEHDTEVIACGYVQIRQSKPQHCHKQHGYLGFMYVANSFRGQGLNQKIMETLIEWAKNKGVEYFYLDVYHDNLPALKAYEKLGFRPNLLEMQLKT